MEFFCHSIVALQRPDVYNTRLDHVHALKAEIHPLPHVYALVCVQAGTPSNSEHWFQSISGRLRRYLRWGRCHVCPNDVSITLPTTCPISLHDNRVIRFWQPGGELLWREGELDGFTSQEGQNQEQFPEFCWRTRHMFAHIRLCMDTYTTWIPAWRWAPMANLICNFYDIWSPACTLSTCTINNR